VNTPLTVAALYVERGGVYANLPDVEMWDETRDARLYAGPHPVVAHPPCARWSRLAGFTEARFGLKRGSDGGCFEAALNAVRTWGGVLEHPAYTDAFKKFDLPRPSVRVGWTLDFYGGASCYIEQGRYGLPVKKATWLYAYGVELSDLRWGYTRDGDGDDIGGLNAWRDRFAGWREAWADALPPRGLLDREGDRRAKPHRGLNSTTPPLFRDALLEMARTAALAGVSE
jgi:hypothetical protein